MSKQQKANTDKKDNFKEKESPIKGSFIEIMRAAAKNANDNSEKKKQP